MHYNFLVFILTKSTQRFEYILALFYLHQMLILLNTHANLWFISYELNEFKVITVKIWGKIPQITCSCFIMAIYASVSFFAHKKNKIIINYIIFDAKFKNIHALVFFIFLIFIKYSQNFEHTLVHFYLDQM